MPTRVCIVGFEAREDVGEGIPRYTYNLIKNLRKVAKDCSIEFLRFGANPRSSAARVLKRVLFAREVYPIKADIYHAVTPQLAIPLMIAQKKPVIITVHDLFPLYSDLGKMSKLEYEYYKQILNRCKAIIATAEYWKRDLISRFQIPEDKVFVVPVGVDHDKFRPMINTLRKSDDKTVLYVGGLSKEKGVGTLLKAFKLVIKQEPKAKLFIGGRGPEEEYFKSLTRHLGIEKSVRFLGFIPEDKLPFYYNMADVFVYPSYTAFGLMLLEAMACGTPVVAIKRFQVTEYVGNAAILVEPYSIRDLADAILEILTNEGLRYALSKRGLERARLFSWERTARMTWNVYSRLLHIEALK